VSPAGLAARAIELLGCPDGPVAICCPNAPSLAAALGARVRQVGDDEPAAGGVVVFLGLDGGPMRRQPLLHALARRLAPGAPVVLVDHNEPRTWWRRVLARLALAGRGRRPRRGRYPAARELAALGFTVRALRLAAGERVQLVVALNSARAPGQMGRAG
jgi:hypothetical protein